MLRPVNISNFNSTHYFVIGAYENQLQISLVFWVVFFVLVCKQAAGVLRNQWPDEAMFPLFVTT